MTAAVSPLLIVFDALLIFVMIALIVRILTEKTMLLSGPMNRWLSVLEAPALAFAICSACLTIAATFFATNGESSFVREKCTDSRPQRGLISGSAHQGFCVRLIYESGEKSGGFISIAQPDNQWLEGATRKLQLRTLKVSWLAEPILLFK